MNYKETKDNILEYFIVGDLKNGKELLSKIENIYSFDVDILYFKAFISFLEGNVNKSKYLCKKILYEIPFHFNTNELMVYIYEIEKDFKKLSDLKLFFLNLYVIIDNGFIYDKLSQIPNLEDVESILDYIYKIFYKNNIEYNEWFITQTNWGHPIEEFLYRNLNNYLFTRPLIQIEEYVNTSRLEGFKQYNNEILEEGNYILPIYSYKKENIISLFDYKNNKDMKFILNNINYYLFNINQSPNLKFDSDLFIGKPIPKFKYENNKDLVLTIFVDGFSQYILEEYGGLEKLMPHTYKFFKDYLYFDNYYVAGEWTHVGMATYFTGQYTANHNIFHSRINEKLKDDIKLLSEYISEKKYFTSKIDSNDRNCFAYNYYRGFDYMLYEPYILNNAMKAREIPSLLIDNIETFKDTNMYISTCIPDLHDIADNYNLPNSIQVDQDFNEKIICENYKYVLNSVKNQYDEKKIKIYIRILKYIDTHLRTLYSYLEDNFDLDNTTITLISDHGQGYFVKPDEEFLSDARTKVPLLIRSKEVKGMKCSELVSNVDYMAIMDKLLDLNVDYRKIDSNLPACLGGKEREYTYTESIYPGDPYKARINIDNYHFYFETKEVTRFDSRVILDEYTAYLKDKNTKEVVENKEILEKCINIVFEHMKHKRFYI